MSDNAFLPGFVKVSQSVWDLLCKQDFHSVKNARGLMVLDSANPLMMLYICTKIGTNIPKGFRAIERTRLPW